MVISGQSRRRQTLFTLSVSLDLQNTTIFLHLCDWEHKMLEMVQVKGWDSSAGTASDWKARHNADMGLSPMCSNNKNSPIVNKISADSPTLPASKPVHTLKIPNTGSHTIVWTHKNTPCTGRNRQCCSCSCCSLTLVKGNPNFLKEINKAKRQPQFPERD